MNIPMNKLSNHTALKEWASVVAALGEGAQVLLLRKGGIADPEFALESDRFYLFPTYLHQNEKQFKPGAARYFTETARSGEPAEVDIEWWGEVAGSWSIPDLDTLLLLDPLFIFTRETILERFRFRPRQKVQLIALRAFRLPKKTTVPFRPEYGGCKSWISLEEEIDVTGSRPVLRDEVLRRRLDEVESVLNR